MNKLLSFIAITSVFSFANANTILPEISRDGKTLNNSVISTSLDHRNFLGLKASGSSLESDTTPSFDVDSLNAGAFGVLSLKDYSMQMEVSAPKTERGSALDSSTDFSFLGGYRVNEIMSLGLGFERSEVETNLEEQRIQAGGSLKLDGKVFGGSVAYHEQDKAGFNGGYFVLTAGFGQQEKKDSVEAGVQLKTEGSDDLTTGKRFSIFSSMTRIVNGVEIDGNFTYEFGNYYKDDGDTTDGNNYNALSFEFDAEFMLFEKYYITPGIVYSAENAPGTSEDTSSTSIGVDFGYRSKLVDTTASVDYIFMGEENDVDIKGLAWGFNVAYAF